MTPEDLKEIVQQYELLQALLLKERQYDEADLDERDAFQRDYARILYSTSFRRLQGKMQIFGVDSTAFYRNRLTHSLEVAQIASGLANFIGDECRKEFKDNKFCDRMYRDDAFLITAAALAHDIGHPAFGHSGERALHRLGAKQGLNFESNAQNYRVLRYIEKKLPEKPGLNLTYRTLLAINKYITKESEEIKSESGYKKFMYDEDYYILDEIREKTNLKETRTLDVQIIELADDIAYAAHDLEDGLSRQKFSIDEVLYQIRNYEQARNQLSDMVSKARKYAEKETNGDIQEYSKLFRMKLTSILVHDLMHDICCREVSQDEAKLHGTKQNKELSLNTYKELLKLLKETTFRCLTKDNEVKLYETRGEYVLQTLFSILTNKTVNEKGMLMPPEYRPRINEIDNDHILFTRRVLDYIGGMMDTYAIELFEKFTSINFNNINLRDINRQDIKIYSFENNTEQNINLDFESQTINFHGNMKRQTCNLQSS